MPSYNVYVLDKWLVNYPTNIEAETFAYEPDYYGIIFFIDKIRYELIHNRHLGSRILINGSDGSCRDIPLNNSSISILPPIIEMKEV